MAVNLLRPAGLVHKKKCGLTCQGRQVYGHFFNLPIVAGVPKWSESLNSRLLFEILYTDCVVIFWFVCTLVLPNSVQFIKLQLNLAQLSLALISQSNLATYPPGMYIRAYQAY